MNLGQLEGLLSGANNALGLARAALAASSVLFADPQTAKAAVALAIAVESSDLDSTGNSALSRKWIRRARPALVAWIQQTSTAKLVLRFEDDEAWEQLLISLDECLNRASAPLKSNRLEGLACSLIVVSLNEHAPAGVRAALSRAQEDIDRGDDRAWRNSVVTLLEGVKRIGTASVPAGSTQLLLEARLKYLLDKFVGRDELIDSLERIQPGEVVIVEADSGEGKTALVATLYEGYRQGWWTPDLDAVAFVRISIDEGRRSARQALLSLNEQLADFLGEDVPAGDTVDVMRHRAADLLRRTFEAGLRPLLIFDGLDEQDDDSPTVTQVISDLVSPACALILSSRRNPDLTSRLSPGNPLREAKRLVMNRMTVDEVKQLMTFWQLDPGFADEIHRITGGFPLYVRDVCEALYEHGSAALARSAEVPLRTANEYFRDQILKLEEDCSSNHLTRSAVDVIASTAGPISRVDLASFLSVSLRDLDLALKPVERYLLPGNYLAFVHVEFKTGMQRRLGSIGTISGALLEWGCKAVDSHEPIPEYILLHHAHALQQAGRTHEIVSLIGSRWARAHWEYSGNWHNFLYDVGIALDATVLRGPPPQPDFVGLSYLRAHLRAPAGKYDPSFFEALGVLGLTERAERTIDFVPGQLARIKALASLAKGMNRDPKRYLRRAEDEASMIAGPETRSKAYVEVISAMTTNDHLLERSLNLLSKVVSPEERAEGASLIAIAMAPHPSMVEQAAQLLPQIDDQAKQSHVAYIVVNAMVHDPTLLSSAAKIAIQISEPDYQYAACLAVIEANLKGQAQTRHSLCLEDRQFCNEIAENIRDPAGRAEAYALLAHLGDDPPYLETAMSVALAIEDPIANATAWFNLILTLGSDHHLLNQAGIRANDIEVPLSRATALAALAIQQGSFSHLDGALKESRRIEDTTQRAYAVCAALFATYNARLLDRQAQEELEKECIELHAHAVDWRVYCRLIELVKHGGPVAFLNDAVQRAPDVDGICGRFMLDTLEAFRERRDLLSFAEDTIRRCPTPWLRDITLAGLAGVLAEEPQGLAKAEAVAHRIEDEDFRAEALTSIVLAGGRASLLDEAEQLYTRDRAPRLRSDPVLRVIRAMARDPSSWNEAAETARSLISDDYSRTIAFCWIVRRGGPKELLSEAAALVKTVSGTRKHLIGHLVTAGASCELLRDVLMPDFDDSDKGMSRDFMVHVAKGKLDIVYLLASRDGLAELALEICEQVKFPPLRVSAYLAVWHRLRSASPLESAQQLAQSLPAARQRARAWMEIGWATNEHGCFQRAEAEIARMRRPDERAWTWVELAVSEPERRESLISRIVEEVRLLRNAKQRVRILVDFVGVGGPNELLPELERAAQAVRHLHDRIWAVEAAVSVGAPPRFLLVAEQAIRRLVPGEDRDWAAFRLTKLMGRHEETNEKAQRLTQLIASPSLRLQALAAVVQPDGDRDLLYTASADLASIPRDDDRAETSLLLGDVLASQEVLKGAEQAARKISDVSRRSRILSDVAEAMARHESLVDTALAIARQLSDPRDTVRSVRPLLVDEDDDKNYRRAWQIILDAMAEPSTLDNWFEWFEAVTELLDQCGRESVLAEMGRSMHQAQKILQKFGGIWAA